MRLVEEDGFAEAYKALARISRIQSVMTLSWDVLSTLTPVDYLAFRHVLGTSSGFQSAQFREIEYRLGLRDPAYLEHYAPGTAERARLEEALAEPSLRDSATQALERAGFDLGTRSADELAAAWLEVYRDAERWFDLYQLAEKLVDIDDALAAWRHKHVLTVERIIGNKPGTGGSAGAAYLASTLDKRVFPDAVGAEDRIFEFQAPVQQEPWGGSPRGCTSPRTAITSGPTRVSMGMCRRGKTPPCSPTANGTRSWARSGREAQAEVAAELGTGDPQCDRFRSEYPRAAGPLVLRRAVNPARAGADHRGRVPQRPPPVRAFGGSGRSCGRAGSRRAIR